ncbi:predicted protein [Nematostella vectensis]|uniref:Uncharacterized protein n=1 Tax=Nematostella vectensis TaxID=45351 RepID=A7SVU9_NEMVE|nr:predicted protein [Nematostella vectensis]|eukprot:XP_001624264.1 predicted protein [Nematostella vectensis]
MDAVEDNAGKYSEKEKKLNNYESSVESVSPERSERRGKSSKKHKHKHSKSKKKHKKRRHRSRTRSKSREKGDTYAEGTLDESVVEGPLLPSVEVSHEKNEQKSQPNSPVDNDNSESKRRSRSRSFSWPPRERNSKSKSKSRSPDQIQKIKHKTLKRIESHLDHPLRTKGNLEVGQEVVVGHIENLEREASQEAVAGLRRKVGLQEDQGRLKSQGHLKGQGLQGHLRDIEVQGHIENIGATQDLDPLGVKEAALQGRDGVANHDLQGDTEIALAAEEEEADLEADRQKARHIVPTVDPTKPLTEQFPVSCGTKHHEKEDEVTIETAVKGVDAIAEMAPKVFEPPPQEKVDVSNLVVKRMEAQRRLQADPNDIEAMLLEQEVSLKMQSWAQSNVKPGQFTGHAAKSTLSKQEIHSGYQAWAKKCEGSKMFTKLSYEIVLLVLSHNFYKENAEFYEKARVANHFRIAHRINVFDKSTQETLASRQLLHVNETWLFLQELFENKSKHVSLITFQMKVLEGCVKFFNISL